MIEQIISKLPFIDRTETINYYGALNFVLTADYGDYLILNQGEMEIHFFHFPSLVPAKSDFMIYLRVDTDIDGLYQTYMDAGISIHPNAPLGDKPWGQREFALIDPNGTLLTFGQTIS